MDPSMEIQSVKRPVHHHPLYPSSRFLNARCHSCKVEGCIHGGYRCNDSDCLHVWFHKECAESTSEINHPNQLTKFDSRREDVIEDDMSHDHPLVPVVEAGLWRPCEACNRKFQGWVSYSCDQCHVYFDLECVNQSKEVNHPCHPNHSLKFTTSKSLSHDDVEKTCLLCGEELVKSFYDCNICNFSLCLYCSRNPPPLTIEHLKTHAHHLILLPRKVTFICNVCGMQGDQSPYVCFPYGFMVHRGCIDLPRVINFNRHDHRISFTPHLGSGNLKCPVCRQGINRYYGAYSCSIYKDYAVHSHCATREDVWDGIELEGMPEDTEDLASFKEEGDNLIRHFLHEEHVLRLNKDGLIIGEESTRCEACIFPVYSDPVYSCEQCDFVLHERCAKFPRKKRNMCYVKPLQLKGQEFRENYYPRDWFQCKACKTLSSGFRYISSTGDYMDVICSSFSEPFDRHNPLPPLFLSERDAGGSSCVACGKLIRGIRAMRSDDGKFVLDFCCANLPKKVKHEYDEHPLSLCYGEDASGKYWCDICERETDPKRWFYTCSHCGTTLHIDCVLGDFSNLKPGSIYYTKWWYNFQVVPNNGSTRPFCWNCHSRCKAPFILQIYDWSFPEYYCSLSCAMPIFRRTGFDCYFSVYHLV